MRLSQLNAAQSAAVGHRGSHLLIIAGPGTGKTHTLTCRIAEVLKGLKSGRKVLAVTFTNKAAQEMRERLEKSAPNSEEKLTVGTFHSFCLKLLRQHVDRTELPGDFQVVAQDDPANRDDLASRGLVDFDRLLSETLKLLQTNPDVRSSVQKTYPYIFVDEFQDINRIQYELLKEFSGRDNRITAIGDPNQSIYGFRGSDVSYFDTFKDDFPNAVTLSLSENYRNYRNLLKASSQVIKKGNESFEAKLKATVLEPGRLTVHTSLTEKAEAEYVVHQVEKAVGGTSMFSQDSRRVDHDEDAQRSFGDIAVLYRLNSQGRVLKEAFERSGIPYHMAMPGSATTLDEVCPHREEDVRLEVEKVSLMTIHKAKGLEFPVVFIVGCEENIIPLNMENLVSAVDEERRLFYVGMTRAKDRLYLTRARERRLYGRTYRNEPSRFLKDIEEELKEVEQRIEPFRKKIKNERQLNLFN